MNHRIRPLCTNKKCKAFRNTVFNKKKKVWNLFVIQHLEYKHQCVNITGGKGNTIQKSKI